MIFGNKETVLDGVDAPFNRVLNAVGPRRMGKSLTTVLLGRMNYGRHLGHVHLRRCGHATRLEVDDPTDQQLDAIGSSRHSCHDTNFDGLEILDRIAHERDVPTTMMNRGSRAIDPGSGGHVANSRPRFLGKRQADAPIVASISDRADASGQDSRPA